MLHPSKFNIEQNNKVMGMRFELTLINFRDLEDSSALTTQPTHQYN